MKSEQESAAGYKKYREYFTYILHTSKTSTLKSKIDFLNLFIQILERQNCRFLLISHKLLCTIFHMFFYDLPCRHLLNSYLVLITHCTVLSVSFWGSSLFRIRVQIRFGPWPKYFGLVQISNVELDQKWIFNIECFDPVIFSSQFKIDFDQ